MPEEPFARRFGKAPGRTIGSELDLVVGVAEIDGILIDAFEQQLGDRGHLRFGVSHGGGTVAVDIAEVALPVHQRVTLRKVLRQTRQRVIDRLVAVRVIVTHHFADDLCTFPESRSRPQAHVVHRIDDAAMNRLQAVTHIRQCAVHDGRQRIAKVALFERRLQVDRLNIVAVSARRR